MKKLLSIAIICLVIFSAFTILSPKLKALALVSRAPIWILSDSDFTLENGVSGGSGTAEDPYVIEGWDIYAITHAILLNNTRAHFIIRNCYLHGGGALYDGVWMRNVTNGVIERITSTGNAGGISASYAPSSNILIRNNFLSSNYVGILISGNSHNIEVVGNEISYNSYHGGIRFGWHSPTSSNTIRENNIHDNNRGIYVGLGSSGNFIHHNNFVDNTVQVYISMPATNIWDNGYPSGGNYWSDYTGIDDYGGPNQDQPGSDGLGDTPYVIDEDNQDDYPLMSPVVTATIDIDPDTLNLESNGKWITAYIELPEGYSVGEIDVSSVLLNDSIGVDPEAPTEVGDYDVDDIPDLMVKFDRAAVIAWLGTVDYREDTGKSVEVTFVITGKVAGTSFEGADTIRVLSKG